MNSHDSQSHKSPRLTMIMLHTLLGLLVINNSDVSFPGDVTKTG
jgi:hypothetical protein